YKRQVLRGVTRRGSLSPGAVLEVARRGTGEVVASGGPTFCRSVARCRPARGGDRDMFLLILNSIGAVVTCLNDIIVYYQCMI
ncbi:hypothetical protein A2U01_0077172, partial [Trifolium medium]|nr:hypothetical protein [Trifolium medium]